MFLAPCKEFQIPEFEELLLMESGIQLEEYGIPPRIGIRNPSSTDNDLESSTWNPESMAWNSESKIVLDALSLGDVLRTVSLFSIIMQSTVR